MAHLTGAKMEQGNGSGVIPPFEDGLMVILRCCGVREIVSFFALETVANIVTAGAGKTILAYIVIPVSG
jgi:hypothetical protein